MVIELTHEQLAAIPKSWTVEVRTQPVDEIEVTSVEVRNPSGEIDVFPVEVGKLPNQVIAKAINWIKEQ